mmetsp:Transcript_8703/g.8232  ORF Transcript_8703/g.8232 Transcript_8703/m.8232 type:complete len:98 (-) Transcript_8703:818-1111(-)
MHRDLNPNNILVNPETLQIKIVGFGSSTYFSESQDLDISVGQSNYVAPEVIGGKYNKEADVWSIGIITYKMLTGSLPFSEQRLGKINQKILRNPLKF